ncbi:DUF3558 family protein [Saccharomonospora halophila]|uniref:DUF3558 family protein n=1 Tax=Saccharomonospora halophila TaxID=129922 RepID=UPI0018DE799A
MTAAAVLLAACSNAESGSPVSTSAALDTSSTSSDRGEVALGAIDPCSLLEPAELSRVGDFEQGVEGLRRDGSRECHWTGVRQTAHQGDVPGIYLVVRGDSGLDEFGDIGSGVRTGTTEATGRRIKQTRNEDGCIVGLAVGVGGRVDAIATQAGPERSCDMANELAEIVDPKIPEGE